MKPSHVVAIRVSPQQLRKLNSIAGMNDTSRSWVMRQLVDRAELITPALFAPRVADVHKPQKQEDAHVSA